jgi:hypothetical protein
MASSTRAAKTRIPRDKPVDGWPAAVDAFLSQPGLSAQTRRSYRLTLSALTAALDTAGAEPTPEGDRGRSAGAVGDGGAGDLEPARRHGAVVSALRRAPPAAARARRGA